ncbi:hypothetical protein [Streptomyces sp. NPDC050856]|uniref:hypothetical protein n=1 Tax=Streptomyces sp. NPDC050856 TaxID=3154939 RepID=UPI0033C96287
MKYPIRQRPRMWARAAVALACAGVMALTGLPGPDGRAEAAPKPGKRCDELFKDLIDGLNDVEPAKPGTLPWDRNVDMRPESDWDEYTYWNQRQAMDALTLPDDPAERDEILKKYDQKPESYKEGTPGHVYSRFKRYLDGKNGTNEYGSFKAWLNDAYIEVYGRNPRGKMFHAKVVRDLGLVGPDWICEETIEVTDPETKEKYNRRVDAINKKTKDIVEVKSGGNDDTKQRKPDRALVTDPKWKEYRFRGVFGQDIEKEARSHYNKLIESAGKDKDGQPRVKTYVHKAFHKVDFTPGQYTSRDTTMSLGDGRSTGSRGSANNMAKQSPPTPADLKRQLDAIRRNDPNGMRVRGPGGVDFSTLELRYVGTPVKGRGLDYSFSAKKADEDSLKGYGGEAKAELVSDAFFTWLALTPDKFWVNLNPDTPDKIMDARFGKTDAGRVLLEADLEMKRDYADAMNPTKREEADRFWKSMPRDSRGVPCWFQVRNWIEPTTAVVREQDGGLYILDAPLKVKSEYLKIDNMPPGAYLCDFDETRKKWAERQVNTLIIPEVEKRINSDPKYADLRRVYKSRVAAEWIRQQDAKKPTDYRKVINSNDVTRWPLRGENKDWTRESTYQAYLKSLKDGEADWEHDAGGGPYTYSVGGVDFSKAPKRNMPGVRFKAEHQHLPRTTKVSVRADADDAEDKSLLALGGNSAGENTGGGGGQKPTPVPTPTPTPTPVPGTPAPSAPGPTDQPSTPAPQPSAPGGGGGDRGTRPNDPGGDLADTGSDAPVALIAGTAAALAAAGAALVWWMRRRRATPS